MAKYSMKITARTHMVPLTSLPLPVTAEPKT